jgi:hypothetical protein
MDNVVSVVGWEPLVNQWYARCIQYNLTISNPEFWPAWEEIHKLCVFYLDWHMQELMPEISSEQPDYDTPLWHGKRRQTLSFAFWEIEGLVINEGRLLLDTVPPEQFHL